MAITKRIKEIKNAQRIISLRVFCKRKTRDYREVFVIQKAEPV